MIYRDYQAYAIQALFDFFESGASGNPIVAMPTGTGKSIVIGGFIKEALTRYPNQRIIKLTHVKELIEQNFEKLMALWPTAPAGIYSAGLKRKDLNYSIVYAGIASLVKTIQSVGWVDLILIDECHLVSPKEGTMYRLVIDELLKVNPSLKVIGFTATHYRQGQGMLIEGDGIFTDICVDMTTMDSFNWFIDEGYLCPLIPRATELELNVDGVKIQQGEYQLKSLQEAVDQQEITYRALQEAIALAPDRNHWLVFASGIDHALHVAGMLDSLGIPATAVHSKMTDHERDKRILDFKTGRVRALVNNGILTTGFDYPELDLIIMLRPTRSPGLWVQMLGRGTRPVYADGFDLSTTAGRLAAISNSQKKNCLVLDFAGNTRRLGPINDPVPPKRKGKKKEAGDAPVRICEQCNAYCHASLRQCPFCFFEFPKSVKIGFKAGTEKLIANNTPVVESFPVDKVVYRKHLKDGKPTSLRATYYCGLRMFERWVCLEHSGYPRKLAHDWWRDASQGQEPPLTVDEAMARLPELHTPSAIDVWINKQHPEILNHVFG